MSQPVKLSDALVNDARATSAVAERSIAGQIEFWARLGKAIEPILDGDQVLKLRQSGDQLSLAHILQTVDSPEGRERLKKHLDQIPFPHFEAADQPGYLIRIDEDGTKTTGQFVDGTFVTEQPANHENRAEQS
ncbi:hypothetical protein Pan97_32910 [Bremerella volcania]|uniref:ParD-like antitoxin of type II bacterial toxin-antitoxin system n=1 Tax=Bremerella volcania TaxID=2527984 RepID=A0A518CAJ2_9BACT|nr:hypothetical protein [Bremerella volcania]QDU76245.1 hypothetical protein Pan97_32910 [Bremerella volcania]